MPCHQSLPSFISSLKNYKALYEEPIFAIAILRLLDDETTSFVIELIHTSLHMANIKAIPNVKERINNLLALNLIAKTGNNVTLDLAFRKSLLSAFAGFNLNQRFKKQDLNESFEIKKAKETINQVSDAKFRSILELVVSNYKTDLFGIKDVLFFCELVDKAGEITNKGFEFLLKNKKEQLWFLSVNAISFYSKSSIEELSYLLDLMEIVMKKEKGVFYVKDWKPFYSFLDSIGVILLISKRKIQEDGVITDLNEILVDNSDLFDQGKESNNRKFISLETNFKIYAYTAKSYEKSVLSLFSKTSCTFPNLIKAIFDEESIIAAFNKGITTKQIIKYLQEYCEDVPKNIINQIHIWEQKQHRIRVRNGYLYHDFIHLSDFNSVCRFVEIRNSLIYKDEQKRVIIAEERTHDEVKDFIKELSKT